MNRRHRAIAEGWRGEVEGLDLALTFLRSKRERACRFQRTALRVDPGEITCKTPSQARDWAA
ncbi:hypothetical protein BN2537_17267 [Streptomyces venezuelae]|nr:hypothetical protein U0M97_00330 [Streptomyces venezuelae]CUM44151.1 hypothetical protein BN2537_17267 [Streptomyces venezuelae]